MKIVQLVHGFPPDLAGGTERYVQALSSGLRARGIDVSVVAGVRNSDPEVRASISSADGSRVIRIHRSGPNNDRWDRLTNRAAADLVAKAVREEQPSLVHVHHWLRLSDDLVRRTRRAGIASAVTLHDLFTTCPTVFRVRPDLSFCHEPPSSRTCRGCLLNFEIHEDATLNRGVEVFFRALRSEIECANRVLALSHSQARLLASFLGFPEGRLEVVTFAPQYRLRPSPPPPAALPLRIVNWGNQTPVKGQHVLLHAVERMRHRRQVEVHLYGGFDLPWFDGELEKLATRLPVTRHGPYHYSELEAEPFHLAVFPSVCHETYGFVLDEAQMLGLPALVSNRGAYAERLGGGGATFPVGNAGVLAALLDALVESPERLANMRRQVREPPTFSDHLDAVIRVYEEVLSP